MNLLAHAVLSPDQELIRIGNVLADFFLRSQISDLAIEIQEGVSLHKKIDHFTDSHPIVERSKARLIGFQRFGNPLVDVFYDHFLTKSWAHEQTIRRFTDSLYRAIEGCHEYLPQPCVQISQRMIEQDWMNQYDSFDGMKINLLRMEQRIESRTGRTVDLVSSLQILEREYSGFEADFLEFWPQLVGHVS